MLPTMQRTCGECNACCRTMPIRELGKPVAEPCSHLRHGRCGIYDERPEVCRVFRCQWLMGVGEQEHRPDRMGAMLTVHPQHKCLAVWLLDGRVPERMPKPIARAILQQTTLQKVVLVFYGRDYGRVRKYGPGNVAVDFGAHHMAPDELATPAEGT